MAKLRVSVIRPMEEQCSLPVSLRSVVCDQTLGVQLTGPLDALLRRVEEYTELGIDADCISMELVLDLRPKGADRVSGPSPDSIDCILAPVRNRTLLPSS